MRKKNLKIKEKITTQDITKATEFIARSVFIEDNVLGDYGYMTYAPYLYEDSFFVALVLNFVSGLSFEKNEKFFQKILNDPDLAQLKDSLYELDETYRVIRYAQDLIEFKKHETLNTNKAIYEYLLNREDSVKSKVKEILDKETKRLDPETKALKSADILAREQKKQLEYMNQVNEYITPKEYADMTKRMSDSNFDPYQIAELVTKKYLDSDAHKNNLIQIAEHRNKNVQRNDN